MKTKTQTFCFPPMLRLLFGLLTLALLAMVQLHLQAAPAAKDAAPAGQENPSEGGAAPEDPCEDDDDGDPGE